MTWESNHPGLLFLRNLTLNFAAGTAILSAATPISVANSTLACGNGGTCVPQKGTAQPLDTLGDRLMYRMGYRKVPGSRACGNKPFRRQRRPSRYPLV